MIVTRLISPLGVRVTVSAEKADRLIPQGFKPVEESATKRAPRRRAPKK